METRSSLQQVVNFGTLAGTYSRSRTVEKQRSAPEDSLSATRPGNLDTVSLSRQAREQYSRSRQSGEPGSPADTANSQLNRQEIEQLQDLKLRDKEVRSHEQAHLSAAGPYARGGMSFTYQKGPDGVSYAVGGEVGIDMGEEATPEATLQKMQTIRKAALAPANPSSTDRQIAARAAAKAAQARQEILSEAQEGVLKTVAGPGNIENPAAAPSADSATSAPPSSSYASFKSAIAAYRRTAES